MRGGGSLPIGRTASRATTCSFAGGDDCRWSPGLLACFASPPWPRPGPRGMHTIVTVYCPTRPWRRNWASPRVLAIATQGWLAGCGLMLRKGPAYASPNFLPQVHTMAPWAPDPFCGEQTRPSSIQRSTSLPSPPRDSSRSTAMRLGCRVERSACNLAMHTPSRCIYSALHRSEGVPRICVLMRLRNATLLIDTRHKSPSSALHCDDMHHVQHRNSRPSCSLLSPLAAQHATHTDVVGGSTARTSSAQIRSPIH
jgi:hypothetical protein